MPIRGETLTPLMTVWNSESLQVGHRDLACGQGSRSIKGPLGMKIGRAILLLLVAAVLAALPWMARAQSLLDSGDPSGTQSLLDSGDSSGTQASTTTSQLDLSYERPTQRTKVNNYLFDAFGPYPIVGAAFGAGINQGNSTPPEWGQGSEGYARRFGSDLGIAAVGTTTRYALSEAFKEDTLYYRCECRGVLPRLRHAMISTLTARRGKDGHLVFSVPALVAPYAGSMTAVYGWYPNRYGAKDAFRTGNYSLLAYMGSNIALEFLYSGPHSLLHRMHLNNAHGSPEPGPNH
jgi:hypothetical protein